MFWIQLTGQNRPHIGLRMGAFQSRLCRVLRLLERVTPLRQQARDQRILPHRETVIVAYGRGIIVGMVNNWQHA